MAEKEKRYYYKSKDGKGYLNLKSKLSEKGAEGYEEITEDQFLAATRTPEPTAAQKAKRAKRERIAFLKGQLAKTDYVVIKIAEGAATADEYADVISQRQSYRAEINQLLEEVE